MVRKWMLALALSTALSPAAFALGGYGTLKGDDKRVAEVLKEQLQVSEDDAFALFNDYLKSYLDTQDWHYNYYHNGSVDTAKLSKSSTRTLHLNFTTDNRFINVTLIRFGVEGQVMIHALETLPRSTSTTVEKYNAVKGDSKYTAEVDKEGFSSYRKTGYTSRVKLLVNGGVGGIQYVDMYVHNLLKK